MFKKINGYLKNKVLNTKSYFSRVGDAKLARAEGYSDGINEATRRLTGKINEMTQRIGDLTKENLNIEAKLRAIYDERIAILEARQTKNCKDCMRVTENERERLRSNQSVLLDTIQRFNIVFMRIFKHTNLVVDEHDNIIKSSGRVKASRDILLDIKSEADTIIKKAQPLLSTGVTEGTGYEEVVKSTLTTSDGNGKDLNSNLVTE